MWNNLITNQRVVWDIFCFLHSTIPLLSYSRTLIDMSLAVRSLDLDFEKGVFRTDGYMKLRWTDKRQV